MTLPVVWLHGVGGPPQGPYWRRQLDRDLRRRGHARLGPRQGIAVDYQAVLTGGPGGGPLPPPVDPVGPEAYAAARAAYESRRRALAAQVEPWRDPTRSVGLRHLPGGVRRGMTWGAGMLPWQGFPLARVYLERPALRRRVLAATLEQLPDEPFVLVAHSLGSVVTLDLLDRLAPGLVRLLVTVGSPLGLPNHARSLTVLRPFPYERLGAWVNLRMRWDWITGGVALDRVVPQVVDVPLATEIGAREHHWRSTYLEHPAVVDVIGGVRDAAT